MVGSPQTNLSSNKTIDFGDNQTCRVGELSLPRGTGRENIMKVLLKNTEEGGQHSTMVALSLRTQLERVQIIALEFFQENFLCCCVLDMFQVNYDIKDSAMKA